MMTLERGVLFYLLVVTLLATVSGCTAPVEVPPSEVEGEIGQVVEVETEGLTCHYLRQSSWGEAEFSGYFANQAKFKSDFQKDFEQGLTQSDRPVSASDYNFFFDSATQSTVSRCDVHGAISKRADGYHGTFFWLLRPLGLDFIDDNFEKSDNRLCWEGSVNDIPTTITLKFPKSLGHCHAHAWWSE